MKELVFLLAFVIVGALGQHQNLGGFEDLLTPEERRDADKVKEFSHFISDDLEEPYQSAMDEMLDIVSFGESDDLEFDRGNKTKRFTCKNNVCSICFSKRKIIRKIKICVTLSYNRITGNISLKVTRNKRTFVFGSTSAKSPKPICKRGKCPVVGPFCGVLYKMKKTTKGYDGCLLGRVTIFNKKVMRRKVGCFSFQGRKYFDVDDLAETGSDVMDTQNLSSDIKTEFLKTIYRKYLQNRMEQGDNEL